MPSTDRSVPALKKFTPAERRLIKRLRTPDQVQKFLNALPYNTERKRETLMSFRQVVRHKTAHCLEAALFATVVLEQHGYPALVMGLESVDYLDHVIFVYRKNGRWGSVARSRDPGLHGRKPVFASPRALALSYFDEYIDLTGRVTGYAVIPLSRLGGFDWRFARKNMWAVERFLTRQKHAPIKSSPKRVRALRKKYRAYLKRYKRKPIYYSGRSRWTPIPAEFL